MNDFELICVYLMNFICYEVFFFYLDLKIVFLFCILLVKDFCGGKFDIVILFGVIVKWFLESYFLFVNLKG